MDLTAQLRQQIADIPALEALAVITALAYVLLAAREKRICFVFGGISAALYMYIVFEAAYYLGSVLQLFYIGSSFYGFFSWGKEGKAIEISKMNRNDLIYFILIPLPLIAICGFLFQKMGNVLPYLDAAITILSISTTYLVILKKLENWLLWIVIDLASVYLYSYQDFDLTSALYLAYTIMSVYGFFKWRKQLKRRSSVSQ